MLPQTGVWEPKGLGHRVNQDRSQPFKSLSTHPQPPFFPASPQRVSLFLQREGAGAFIFLSTAHLGLKVSLLGRGKYVG